MNVHEGARCGFSPPYVYFFSDCPAALTPAAVFQRSLGDQETVSTVNPQLLTFNSGSTPSVVTSTIQLYREMTSQQGGLRRGRRFEGRSVWGFQAQVTEERWEVQCFQIRAVKSYVSICALCPRHRVLTGSNSWKWCSVFTIKFEYLNMFFDSPNSDAGCCGGLSWAIKTCITLKDI